MQLVQLVFSVALAPLAGADAPLWAIMIAAVGVGTGNALNAPSWAAMFPSASRLASAPVVFRPPW